MYISTTHDRIHVVETNNIAIHMYIYIYCILECASQLVNR